MTQIVDPGHTFRNRSLGSGPTWPTSGPDAVINEVLANLVYAGLVVSVSAGNSGGIGGLAQEETGLCESCKRPCQALEPPQPSPQLAA